MRNKYTGALLLLVLTIGSLSSCKKWLDVNPSTQLTNDQLFKTEQGYGQALAGVYLGMSSTNLYGREMTFGTMDVLAGYYSPASSGTTTYYSFYSSYPYKRSNASRATDCVAVIDGMWKGMYNNIANVNNILHTIDANRSVFSGDNYHIIKGEALGLRAFLHLDLLRMYGPNYTMGASTKSIPYVDTLSSLVTPLITVDSACNRIIGELKTALSLMGNDPIKTGGAPPPVLASVVATAALPAYHNRKYHFNYYAVEAALARAYLWKGDKVNALNYAKDILANQTTRFPWVTDMNITGINTAGVTNKDRTFTTEHIFGLNINDLENYVPNYFSNAGTNLGNLLYSTPSVLTSIYESNTLDPRYQYLFTTYNSNYFSTKLYQEASTSTWFKHQMPLIRVSEMYYIAAECEPNITDGLAWLNSIRTARKLAPLTGTMVNSPAALTTEIRKEYQKEFIGEGQLWFYYKRQNLITLPYNSKFTNTQWYVFDMPDDEYTYAGR